MEPFDPTNFECVIAKLNHDSLREPPQEFTVTFHSGTRLQCIQLLELCRSPWMSSFWLYDCAITDSDVLLITPILHRQNSRLAILFLTRCIALTHAGATTLAVALNHKNARSLRMLDLSYCPIGDIGACNLAEALQHPYSTLQALVLRETQNTVVTCRYYADMLVTGNQMCANSQMLVTLCARIGSRAMNVLRRFIGPDGNQSLRALHVGSRYTDSDRLDLSDSLKRINLALSRRNKGLPWKFQ